MGKRERWGSQIPPPNSGEDAREAQVQSLFAAAYRSLEPSAAFERRVVDLVARRDSELDRQRAWWPQPLGWASAAGISLVIILAALGFTRSHLQPGGVSRKQPPLTSMTPPFGRPK